MSVWFFDKVFCMSCRTSDILQSYINDEKEKVLSVVTIQNPRIEHARLLGWVAPSRLIWLLQFSEDRGVPNSI